MKPIIQPEMHPDAEFLTAFAEQSVTEEEREQILAHMAVCRRCREVVFLAQKAMEAERPPRKMSEVRNTRSAGPWLSNWRWAWIPVAALAGVVGFAVIEHIRHDSVPDSRMAQNAPRSEMMQAPPARKAVENPGQQASKIYSPSQPMREEAKPKVTAPQRSDRDAEVYRRSFDDKDVAVRAEKKDELPKEAGSLLAVSPTPSGGASHGTFEARAKSSNVGGPLAQNQMQAQNSSQMQQQNYANETRQVSSDSANKPVPPPAQLGSASQTVTVNEEGGLSPVSPASASAPAISAVQSDVESAELSKQKLAKVKAGQSALPSKLGVVSEATVAKRIVAIDTGGSVFVSDDGGKRWGAVKAQWTGRAVLLKTRPANAASGGPLKETSLQFELTTDESEMWVSRDGKQWTIEFSASHP